MADEQTTPAAPGATPPADKTGAGGAGKTAAAGSRTAEGPGARYVRVRGVSFTAAYLILVGALCLYLVVVLWPHPTPSGDLPPKDGTTTGNGAVTKEAVPEPTEGTIPARQAWVCGIDKAVVTNARNGRVRAPINECYTCVERAMRLQFETQRRGDPQCTSIFGRHLIIWQEERLLLLVLLAGAVGALLHAIRSLVAYVGNRNFVRSWLAFYYLSPFSGSMIAFVTYVAIRGGFFASTSNTGDANPFMFIALATLAGLFSHQVIEKLRKVAETAFDKPPEGKNPLPAGEPTIGTITPAKVEVGFSGPVTIDGTGFVAGTVVRVAEAVMTPSRISDKQLTFDLPATATGEPTKLEVVVVTPAPEGGTSDPVTIEVVAAG
jgi:IPT/TIG domain-containing protein